MNFCRRQVVSKMALESGSKVALFLVPWKVRKVLACREFRLATLMPSSYTHTFHADSLATVAQWQSTGFVNQMLWVQLPPVA